MEMEDIIEKLADIREHPEKILPVTLLRKYQAPNETLEQTIFRYRNLGLSAIASIEETLKTEGKLRSELASLCTDARIKREWLSSNIPLSNTSIFLRSLAITISPAVIGTVLAAAGNAELFGSAGSNENTMAVVYGAIIGILGTFFVIVPLTEQSGSAISSYYNEQKEKQSKYQNTKSELSELQSKTAKVSGDLDKLVADTPNLKQKQSVAKDAIAKLDKLYTHLNGLKAEIKIGYSFNPLPAKEQYSQLKLVLENKGDSEANSLELLVNGHFKGEQEASIGLLPSGSAKEISLPIKPTEFGKMQWGLELKYTDVLGRARTEQRTYWIEVAPEHKGAIIQRAEIKGDVVTGKKVDIRDSITYVPRGDLNL